MLLIKDLSVELDTEFGTVNAVRGVSLSVEEGKITALVGESGCGKSVLCKAIMKLLPSASRYVSGSILLDGEDLIQLDERAMTRIRGSRIGMVFQDPMTSLDPCMTIGRQIAESVRLNSPGLSKTDARRKSVELLGLVGITEGGARYDMFPQQFSGGMRQRAVLAAAIAGRPEVILADEPTTALDVTTQAQILTLLRKIARETGISVVLVTHDLGVVARAADNVAVMYAGRIIETGTTDDIFNDPRHPYTWGLLRALPYMAGKTGFLRPIEGAPPSLEYLPAGDAFAERNPVALAIDYFEAPPMFRVSDTHYAATWLLDKRAPKIAKEDYYGA